MNITDRYWTNSNVHFCIFILKAFLLRMFSHIKLFSFITFRSVLSVLKYFLFMFLRVLNLQAGVCLTYICIFTQMFINAHHFSLKKCLCDYLFSLFKQSLWFFKFKQSFFKYTYISIFLKKERKSHFFLRMTEHHEEILKIDWTSKDWI